MANQLKKYTQIGVLPLTQKKLSILAAVIGPSIYGLVEGWTDEAWERAKKGGLVTDAMIQSSEQTSPTKEKKSAAEHEVALAA